MHKNRLYSSRAKLLLTVREEILRRICRDAGVDNLVELLADKLPSSDLHSLMLEVHRRRANRQRPGLLLNTFETNPFVRPAAIDPRMVLDFETTAFAMACPPFEPIELSPLCPLGTVASLTPVSQDKVVSAARGLEVVSDSTNVLALECAHRRQVLRRDRESSLSEVRLCSSHRLVRPAVTRKPEDLAHFRIFGACTAGRDKGSGLFELEALKEHLRLHVRILMHHVDQAKYRATVTDFSKERVDALNDAVLEPLALEFPGVPFAMDPDRVQGTGYYSSLCFHLFCTVGDVEHFVCDGGLTDWTQQLLADRKERLMISGMGVDRVCSLALQR